MQTLAFFHPSVSSPGASYFQRLPASIYFRFLKVFAPLMFAFVAHSHLKNLIVLCLDALMPTFRQLTAVHVALSTVRGFCGVFALVVS